MTLFHIRGGGSGFTSPVGLTGGGGRREESRGEGAARGDWSGGGVTSGQTPSAEQDGQLEQEKEGDAGQPQRQLPGRAFSCGGGEES